MMQKNTRYSLYTCALMMFVAISMLVACGPTTAPTTSLALTGGGKPTGPGTVVSGASQTPVVTPRSSTESIFVANSIAYVNSNDGNLYALRIQDGREMWRYAINSGDSVVYAVTNKTVYAIAGPNFDVVYAIHADTGRLLWQHQLGLYLSGLVFYNNTLYLNANAHDNVDSSLYALNAADGSMRWQQTRHADISILPIIIDGIMYVHEDNMQNGKETLYALRASNGSLLWNYFTGDGSGGPGVANGVAYITTTNSQALAFQETTGKLLWKFTRDYNENAMGDSPTIDNGVVYINAASTIYALRASNGALLWQYSKPNQRDQGAGQPIVGNGAVYITTGEGDISAISASDGKQLWQQHINNSLFGPLTFENGRIQVQTQSNIVYALRASDGVLLWQQHIGSFANGVEQTPYIVSNGVVYVGTDDGIVRAFRTSDGKLLWHYTIPPKAFLPDPVYSAFIMFHAGVSYQQALRAITDFGLQPAAACVNPSAPWKPMETKQGFPTMLVNATPLAPLGWVASLKKAVGIKDLKENPEYFCPLMSGMQPTSGVAYHLKQGQYGTIARVMFSHQSSYDAALEAITEQGFRLANPCYEQLPQGANITWSSMGQEQSFASTQTLLVVTTGSNSTYWQQQLQATAGVTNVETAPKISC